MSKPHHKTTIKYHEDPPYKDESLIHYVRRTKNTLRCLLYYDVSIKDLFDLLKDSYHCYPNLVYFRDPLSRDDYFNELSSNFDSLFENKTNASDIPYRKSYNKLQKELEKVKSSRSSIKEDLLHHRTRKRLKEK